MDKYEITLINITGTKIGSKGKLENILGSIIVTGSDINELEAEEAIVAKDVEKIEDIDSNKLKHFLQNVENHFNNLSTLGSFGYALGSLIGMIVILLFCTICFYKLCPQCSGCCPKCTKGEKSKKIGSGIEEQVLIMPEPMTMTRRFKVPNISNPFQYSVLLRQEKLKEEKFVFDTLLAS